MYSSKEENIYNQKINTPIQMKNKQLTKEKTFITKEERFHYDEIFTKAR